MRAPPPQLLRFSPPYKNHPLETPECCRTNFQMNFVGTLGPFTLENAGGRKEIHPKIGASQMTTKFLTREFAKFPNLIVMEFPSKNSVWGQFSVKFPLPNPLQNANFINIVVSASLRKSTAKIQIGIQERRGQNPHCKKIWPWESLSCREVDGYRAEGGGRRPKNFSAPSDFAEWEQSFWEPVPLQTKRLPNYPERRKLTN